MLAGRLAGLVALTIIVGAGAAYVADSNASIGHEQLLQPPMPGPVQPYVTEATRLSEADAQPTAPEKLIGLAREILRRAPLSAAPFIIASDASNATGDRDAARSLALVALQRDPRNARLQAQLTNDAAGRGNLAEALHRLSVLITIDAPNGGAYLTSMARIAGDPDGPQLIESELADEPRWGARLVNLLTPHHPDLAFLGRLVGRYPEARDGYVSRLVKQIGPKAARAEWTAMLATADRPKADETPFNPTFDPDLHASPPFNWRVRSSTAELNKSEGLFASYEGRGKVVLAEQLMILAPGAYRLNIEAAISSRPKGGSLAWILQCNTSATDLAALPLPDSSYTKTDFHAEFTIPPANCDSQYLRLLGLPAEFTTGATAEIAKAAITQLSLTRAP